MVNIIFFWERVRVGMKAGANVLLTCVPKWSAVMDSEMACCTSLQWYELDSKVVRVACAQDLFPEVGLVSYSGTATIPVPGMVFSGSSSMVAR